MDLNQFKGKQVKINYVQGERPKYIRGIVLEADSEKILVQGVFNNQKVLIDCKEISCIFEITEGQLLKKKYTESDFLDGSSEVKKS